MKEYMIDEVCAKIPEQSAEKYKQLRDSIQTNGFYPNCPMTVRGKYILDGRSRYKACLETGVEPVVVEYQGTEESIEEFVIDMCETRRDDLSKGQKAAIASRMATATEGGDRRGQSDSANSRSGCMTRERAAAKLNISTRSLDEYRAIEKAYPDIAEKVFSDPKFTLNQGVTEMKRRKAKEEEAKKKEEEAAKKEEEAKKEEVETKPTPPPKSAKKATPKVEEFVAPKPNPNYVMPEMRMKKDGTPGYEYLGKTALAELCLQMHLSYNANIEEMIAHLNREYKEKLEKFYAGTGQKIKEAENTLYWHKKTTDKLYEMLSGDNLKMLLSVCHPDREAPADRKNRMFNLVKELKETCDNIGVLK